VKNGCDVVVGVGGDGTANEIICGLMQAQGGAAMGMLAVGRGNDFAYGAGIPKGLEAGCRVLAQDYRQKIDIGRVTGAITRRGVILATAWASASILWWASKP
jgi:diacylglycerol kinase family enzyme